jgi:5-methylcytosine-specific restriction endonuclease McrA
MQHVLVIDKNNKPLMPCHPARARELLKAGKAAVFRRFPFTIILKDRECGDAQPVALKIDPGSRTTGVVLVADFQSGKQVIWGAELTHRGQAIRDVLVSRTAQRRSRRQRKTRYRQARFLNRARPKGWLAPSLKSRLDNIWTWTVRLARRCPITSISQELVRFDTQLMQNSEISGLEYQQGELQGYEVREYLLEKWGRQCAYCGAKDLPLEIEHMTPKTRGGSNRVSNLTLACHICNQKKGSQTAAEFGYPEIQSKAKRPLKDVASVNAIRWVLFEQLKLTGLPVEVGTGGRTKFNRVQQGYPKAHWIDAACVGESGTSLGLSLRLRPLTIQATGRQRRQMTLPDKHGFPRTKAKTSSSAYGFKTGDLVRAVISTGKYAGTHVGRIAIRKRPSFALNGFDVHPKCLKMLHQSDGYSY